MKEPLESLMEYPCCPDEHVINEEKFIEGYMQLTGESQSMARNVYMLLGTVRRGIVYPLWEGEAPNSNLQAPMKSQAPGSSTIAAELNVLASHS